MTDEPELCRYCGRAVTVMCQRGTGFCCQLCAETYREHR